MILSLFTTVCQLWWSSNVESKDNTFTFCAAKTDTKAVMLYCHSRGKDEEKRPKFRSCPVLPIHFLALLQKCEKRLLASLCLSAWNNSVPTGRIFMKFYIWRFLDKCRENSSFIHIWQI